MENPQERQSFDIGWLIGLFDGEGSFYIGETKRPNLGCSDFYPQVNVSNTNHKMIEKAQNILSSLGIACRVNYKQKSHIKNKNYWSLEVQGIRRVKRFMDTLAYLFECRHEQVETLQRYVELRLSKPAKSPIGKEELWLINHLRELNGSKRFVSSESIRRAPFTGEDVLRATAKSVEADRNDQLLVEAIAA